MPEKIICKKINGCSVTVSFTNEKNPGLKERILWYLTECYEAKMLSQANQKRDSDKNNKYFKNT
jgi:hypothetical protein